LSDNWNSTGKTIFFIARILWSALGLTPFILLVVVLLIDNSEESGFGVDISDLSFSDPTVLAMSLAAIVLFFIAQKLPSLISKRTIHLSEGAPDPQHVLIPFVISLALYEAIAIIGFVLSIIKSSDFAYLPFMFISLAGFLSCSPSKVFSARPRGKNELTQGD